MDPALLEYSYTLITVALLSYTLRYSLRKSLPGIKIWKVSPWIIFGVIYNIYSLSWLYTAYPLPWLQSGITQLVGIALLHVFISLLSGVSFYLVEMGMKIPVLARKTQLLPVIFAISLALSEVIRSLVLSLVYYGKGSTVGLHWGAGTIGNALSTTPFVEWAYFGGPYILTAILGYVVYCCTSSKHVTLYFKHIIALVILTLGIHYLVPVTLPDHDITISTVVTNFENNSPSNTKEESSKIHKEQHQKLHNLTLSLAKDDPDIIVYPEDAEYTHALTSLENTELLTAFRDTLFIDGDTRKIDGQVSNISLFYEPQSRKAFFRGKIFLFPFNEYVPDVFASIISLFIGKENMDSYNENHTYTPHTSTSGYRFNAMRVSTIICSEILSFQTLSQLHKENPSIVFYQAHLNVFHNNPWYVMHMRSFSKVAAAQLRTIVVGSSNGAPSYLISPYGEILDTVSVGFSTSTYLITKGEIQKLP